MFSIRLDWGDCNTSGSTKEEIWGDPKVHGEEENWEGAGDGSLLWQNAPVGFGWFGMGLFFFFFLRKKNTLEHRFTNHEVKEEVCKQPVSW